MLKTKRTAALILLVTVILAAVPSLTTISASIQMPENKAENYVALADKAKEQVQNFIDLISANDTAMGMIEQAGLMDEFEGNVTLFNQGVGNLTAAHNALNVSDYEGAIANATNAFKIFRQVFVAIHIILAEAGVPKGRLVDAQGLIEAMERALEKIEKLKEMNITSEVQKLLDNATAYLNIETARLWLQEGRVNDVVENLTIAKGLIAKAYGLIERHAWEMLTTRMRNYIKILNQTCEKIMERLHTAEDKGFNMTDMLGQMGYGNMEQFQQHLQNMTMTAKQDMEQIKNNMEQIRNAIQNMNGIGKSLREIDHDLTRNMEQQRRGQGNGRKP